MQSTGKRALAFALVGCLSLSMCLGGRVSPAVAADAGENSPAAAQPAATQADSATTAGQPATAQGQPATTEGQPATTADQPTSTQDEPATTEGQPATMADQPATTAQDEPATTAGQPAKPSMATQSEAGSLAPAAVGDTFNSTISVGGTDVSCVYKVLTENGSTGTVQVGDGTTSPAISKSASGALVIPPTVTHDGVTYTITTLGSYCFYGCASLTDTGLTTNSTVTSLGDDCFEKCTSLTNTGLGKNSTITSLEDSCFFGCTSLTDTGLGENSTITSLGGSCFSGCKSLTDTGLGKNSTVTSLGSGCFAGETSLTNTGLDKNSSVTSLPLGCFATCVNLKTTGLATNSTIQTIGGLCFNMDTSLVDTGLATNSAVTTVGKCCFHGCASLADVAIGSGVDSLDVLLSVLQPDTLGDCSSLESVCFFGPYVAPAAGTFTSGQRTPAVYRLSEKSGWTGKTASDVSNDAASLKSLSRLSIVGGSTSSTPTQNHWTTLAGTASNGRWVEGDKVQLSATVPAGSSFVKWVSTDPTGSFDDATSATAIYTVGQSDGAETATLTAETAASSYVVHFDANGGSGSMADESMTYGVAANLTTSSFTRSGYAFAGWNTKEDGTGTSYADGQSVEDLDISGTSTVTLYAQWKAQHKVTYSVTGDVPAGYSVPVDDNAYVKGDSVTVAAVPSESGYTFSGWTVDGKEASSFTMDDSDVTVEGVWSKNAEPTTGTPDATGSTGSGSNGTGSNGTVATVSSATSGSGDATTAVTPRTGDANGPAVGLLLVGIALAALGIASRRRSGESSR
ncbi:MAG: leucine-rich repeat protein [Atopobiaceae bacterium]|jgi:uncharacterized repeat protein (TIGR02543 family)|nr:leucine-rich repeat protein [Atopobiaceae bacterium]